MTGWAWIIRMIVAASVAEAGCNRAPPERNPSNTPVDKVTERPLVPPEEGKAESHQTACYPYSLPNEVTSIVWVQLLQGKRVELKREIVEPILRRAVLDDHITIPPKQKGHYPGDLIVKGKEFEVRYALFVSPKILRCKHNGKFIMFRIDSEDLKRLNEHISSRGGQVIFMPASAEENP